MQYAAIAGWAGGWVTGGRSPSLIVIVGADVYPVPGSHNRYSRDHPVAFIVAVAVACTAGIPPGFVRFG